MKEENELTGLEIAVIGMAGRFPGARNIDEFWHNLENGVESITFFSREELEAAGVSSEMYTNPNYVAAAGMLPDKDCFDALFFGYTPKEAEVMDPQVRVFQEVAWEAMEHAGYVPDTYNGLIGLYAGAGGNFYWEAQTVLSGKSETVGSFEAALLNNKDFLSSRVSYKLNLKGPSFTLYTACSTSLVAIHLAARALLTGECGMALAGGITALYPDNYGYVYQEGMINSPDGHCRAFDVHSKGTIFGDGVGVVVLKRLSDALEERDMVHAVIKASAINNDGMRKVGFTAPSTSGEAEVIRTAIKIGKIPSESITYIEAHGTGTQMGDTMELDSMKRAFNTKNDKKGWCAVASVKTNVGHLDAAAGAAGFIKTVLALKQKRIPPGLNFETPNSNFNFASSPFYVNTTLKEWKNDGYPLRAGVSSFGIGGTNAHVILEEAPEDRRSESQRADGQKRERPELIVLSAKTETALDKMTENLANHFKKYPDIDLTDVAYTLQMGRKAFKHRRMVVCKDVEDAVNRLQAPRDSGKSHTAKAGDENQPVVFMFAGLGSQYVNMGRDLYEKEPEFRKHMDRCFDILKPLMDCDFKNVLYPGIAPQSTQSVQRKEIDKKISVISAVSAVNQVEVVQPVVFIFDYTLASLLIKWGISPTSMIGYSFGEYAAACVAGVFSLEDALKLVVTRSRLMGKLPEGAMLSVPLAKEQLLPDLNVYPNLSIAVDNGPSCIAAGPKSEIHTFEKELKRKRIISMPLGSTHAVHSTMMEPILEEFEAAVAAVPLHSPQIPFISNVTGEWITDAEAINPGYWSRHLRETVLFGGGINRLVNENETGAIFLEIGPGRDLSALISRYIKDNPNLRVINFLRTPSETIADDFYLLNKLGYLWLYGKVADWQALHEGQGERYRIPLPNYPYEKKSIQVEKNLVTLAPSNQSADSQLLKKPDMADWFYLPGWKPSILPLSLEERDASKQLLTWLIFEDRCGLTGALVTRLGKLNHPVISIKPGDRFEETADNRYTLNPELPGDYDALFAELRRMGRMPDHILHLWNVGIVKPEQVLHLGFYSLLYIVRALQHQGSEKDVSLTVVTTGMQEVAAEGVQNPEKTTIMGPLKVIPQEHPFIRCRSLDLEMQEPEAFPVEQWAELLERELTIEPGAASADPEIAYRGCRRWVRRFESVRLEDIKKSHKIVLPLKEKGVYLITGGLGGMGLALAEYLSREWQARLILVSRTPLPPCEHWKNPADGKVKKVRELESLGAEVMTAAADISQLEQMQEVVDQAEARFGPIDGIIHAAGVLSGRSFQASASLSISACQEQFTAKIHGLLVLEQLFLSRHQRRPLDFCMIASSIAAVLGGVGFAAYTAGNLFMDAFARKRNHTSPCSLPWIVVNWDSWLFDEEKIQRGIAPGELLMTPREGVEAFCRILAHRDIRQVVHSLGDLQVRIDRWIKLESLGQETSGSRSLQQRPDLMTPYTAPRTPIEETLVEIWQKLFGFEKIGVFDNFFELGGDSLKVLNVAAKIHKQLNVEISVPDFFQNPTIEGIARLSTEAETTQYTSVAPAAEKEFYPLSSAQKRLYIIQQMEKQSIGYNETIILLLEGELDRERLQGVFRQLIRRHESFRTSFFVKDDQPVQAVHSPETVEFEIEFFDLLESQLDDEHVLKNFSRAFDLAKPPLFRVALLKKGEKQFILAVEMHHIISDGQSYQVFIQELMVLYEGRVKLPDLMLQYKDFSQWQNSKEQQQIMKMQEEYWLSRFTGVIPQMNLPYDYPRPAIKSFAGNSVRFFLSPGETAALKKMVQEEEVTLFMLLLTFFNILMFKLSRQDDIIVGTPIFGRRQEELHQIIGMFVNTLALRNFPSAEKTVGQFLQEVKASTLEAFTNQDYQFEELADKRGGERDASRNPLFDVLFTLQNVEQQPLELPEITIPGLKLSPYTTHEIQQAQFDLLMFSHEIGDVLGFKVVYCTRMFKQETVERFTGYFKDIATAALENKKIQLGDIKISHHLGTAQLDIPDTEFDF
jgi:polyketide synthase PksJ